ncbi:protein penguin [Leptopilina heterotoma]|uniref:protein penguin n=1 Tax=Leptopilina heterotoma TaxID=63436 RepID=UPI001CA9A63F|nr:protein penguin [Leptopilina heterotoma]
MKRKDEAELATSEPGSKKSKKTVNFASQVRVREIPRKDEKPEKLSKQDKKQKKKGKFEKQTIVKKLEKIASKKEKIAIAKTPEKPSILKKPQKSQSPSSIKNFENSNKSKKKFENQKSFKPQNNESGEKVDWLDFKKKKKALKAQRKIKKLTSLYDISVQAKKIGEKLRVLEAPSENRTKLSTELHELLKGNYTKFILTHDMSRVIQWLIKYSSAEIRQSIKTELESLLIEMFQSKYAKNCIKAFFQYGTDKLRKEIFSACNGYVIKLSSHTVSAPVFEFAISEYATDADKIRFKQEFYGDMYKHAKDENVKTLDDVYKIATDMKKATLSAVKTNLNRILNKKLASSPIVHTVLNEFLSSCTDQDRDEMIPMLRSLIVDLIKTKDGTQVGMLTIRHGSNKDKKIVMKALKEHVKDICVAEHGHLLIFSLVDSVDDTVLLKKIILTEILNNANEIILNEYGRKVILYLVAHRDSHYFHPAMIELLKKENENSASKKPIELKEKEILDGVIDKFLESIISDTKTWLSSSPIQMVTLAIITSNHDRNLESTFQAIADFLLSNDSKITEDEKEYSAIEHSGLHLILKKLFQKSEIFLSKNGTSLGDVMLKLLNNDVLEKLIQINRGCFLVVFCLENSSSTVVSSLMTLLQSMKKKLTSLQSPGARILLKKLKDCK